MDALYQEFEYITFGLLGQKREKSISEIQFILSSAKVKLLSKRVIKITTKLVHSISRNNNLKRKATVTNKDECFHYHKRRYFEQDCRMPAYRLLKKKSTGNAK